MARSSAWVWKKSYASTDHGLPPVPTDLNIPQFVCLAVDDICDFCHVCPEEASSIVRIWTARLRICRQCASNALHTVREYKLHDSDLAVVQDIRGYFGRKYPLHAFFPSFLPDGYYFDVRHYLLSGIDRVAADYERDNKDKAVHVRKKWLRSRVSSMKKAWEHAKICETWEQDVRQQKRAEEQRARKARHEAIIRKLKELGWSDELKHKSAHELLLVHPLVRSTQPLTEDWDAIRDPILEFVNEQQKKRLAQERCEVLQTRYSALKTMYVEYLRQRSNSLTPKTVFPGVGDLVTFPEVAKLIEGTPLKAEVDPKAMRNLIRQLAKTKFAEWRTTCETALIALLNAADPTRTRPVTIADLKLAATVFSTSSGTSHWWYPEVLEQHSSALMYGPPDCPESFVGQRAWSTNNIRVDVSRLRRAETLITMAGLNPQTATPADIDQLDPWFAFARDMSRGKAGRYAMTWRYAMSGQEEDPRGQGVPNIIKLSPENAKLARKMRSNPRNFPGHAVGDGFVHLPKRKKKKGNPQKK
ncbi:hypothetical protein FB107DRAFT_277242 [Schizophyllum commune]